MVRVLVEMVPLIAVWFMALAFWVALRDMRSRPRGERCERCFRRSVWFDGGRPRCERCGWTRKYNHKWVRRFGRLRVQLLEPRCGFAWIPLSGENNPKWEWALCLGAVTLRWSRRARLAPTCAAGGSCHAPGGCAYQGTHRGARKPALQLPKQAETSPRG